MRQRRCGKDNMTRLVPLTIFFILCGMTYAAEAQSYRPPVGNCDALVMSLESARLASVEAGKSTQKEHPKSCKDVTEFLAAAQRLAQRADALLAACPGMDDAMLQGSKMEALSKAEISAAVASRQTLTSCTDQKY